MPWLNIVCVHSGLTHARLIWHNYVAKHVTPNAFWMHGVAGGITWLIFFFFFFTVLSWNLLRKQHALIRTSSQYSMNIYISSNSCILHGHSVRSSKWKQIVCQSGGLNYLYPTFPFLLSIFCLTSFCSNIDLSSTMMMGGGSAYSTKRQPSVG